MLNKEIRIINYVFKHKDKINLLSIEEYRNYHIVSAKIKLLMDNEYIEKEVHEIELTAEKLIYDDLIISSNEVECFIGKYHINFIINNKELISEYQKTIINKNIYKLFENNNYNGTINEMECSGKLYLDYEVLKTIPDQYYKLYVIDFSDFTGLFSILVHDDKALHLNLSYKDEEFFNKKPLNIQNVHIFKLSNYKFKASGNYFWKIKINVGKTFKSNPSVIPFKYQKGVMELEMKKNLFKSNLKAISREILLITSKFI